MTEHDVIMKTGSLPVTESSLVRDLSALGLEPGMTVLVHSSLSSIGWVAGGSAAVIRALERVLAPEGTLVMPAHSGDLSDPAAWSNPPVPESWWQPIRDEMPAFESDLTPTRGMGAIAETFRKRSGTIRSSHPSVSFTARGPAAEAVTAGHSLAFSLGEKSPLARLYELDARVLLIGVGHDSDTSLHLAEYRSSYPGKTFTEFAAPVVERGTRVWKTYRDLEIDTDDFPTVGEAFERERPGSIRIGKIGLAESRLIRQRDLVDFAAEWFSSNRGRAPA